MSESSSSSSSGIGFFGLLAIVFITLKLTGHITWSWLWVLAPLWIPACVFFILAGLFLVMWVLAGTSGQRRAGTITRRNKFGSYK